MNIVYIYILLPLRQKKIYDTCFVYDTLHIACDI